MLRYVASVIGRIGAAPRFAARYGGEEFGLIFPGESAARGAGGAGGDPQGDLLAHPEAPLDQRGPGRGQRLVGLAEARPGESAHALMERADAALYVSKRTGRNRVTLAEDVADAA